MTAIWRAIDIESSGLDPAACEIIELGWRDIRLLPDGSTSMPVTFEETFVAAEKAIPIEATSVHHILATDLKGAPGRSLAVQRAGAGPVDGFIAHNHQFERSFLPELLGKPWICTYRTALRLLPEAEKHNVSYLRYFLGATSKEEREWLPPHRAGPDAFITAEIFVHLLKLAELPELIRISGLPPLLKRFNFGMHKGEALENIPRDYFQWCLDQPDMDAAVKHSICCEIARRNGHDAEAYFEARRQASERIGNDGQLTDWWRAEENNRRTHAILEGTPLYEKLVALGKDKRVHLAQT